MNRPTRRTTALLALAALPLPLLALGTTPAQAEEATGQVTFEDCEVTWNDENSQPQERLVGDLPMSVTIDHPTPVAAGNEQTVEVSLSELPADTFPMDLGSSAWVEVTLGIDDSRFGFDFYADRSLGSFDASAALDLGDLEQDGVAYADAGVYPWAVRSIEVQVSGDNEIDTGWFFFLECDQIGDPEPVLDVAVYDLDATPELTLDRFTVRQGGKVAVTGRHLLTAAPVGGETVTVTIGGTPVGTLPVDATGAVAGVVRVPEFAAPGNVSVRVANGAKAATAALAVKAVGGKVVTSTRKIAPGKKLTVTGSKFKPGEKVKLAITGGKGAGKKSFAKTVKVTGSGTFSAKVTLKKAAKGAWKVVATGASSKRTGKTSFRVN